MTWAVLGVLFASIGIGMHFAHPSSMVRGLIQPDSDIKEDLATVTWMVSSSSPAVMGGFLMSSLLMDWCGRKKSFAVAVLPGILEWNLLYFGQNIRTLFLGRIAGGMASGAITCLAAYIIGEFTSPELRGTFLTLKSAAICVGSTITHVLGNYYNWRTIALIGLIPYAVALGIACTWPESPSWFALKKKNQKCEKAFFKLRGTSEQARNELEHLIRSQTVHLSTPHSKPKSIQSNILLFLTKFTRQDFLKPLFILFIALLHMEVTGRHYYPAYASQIIGSITGNKSTSFYYTLGIDIMITISCLISSVLVKLFKRRTLLFATSLTALLLLFVACIYLFLMSKRIVSDSYTFIPIVMFLIYFMLANVGSIPLTVNLLGEIFPLVHKSVGSCMAGLIISTLITITLRTTLYLINSLNVYGMFGVYGSIQLITLVILYFILPETKDRTLQEIEDYFNGIGFKNDNKLSEEEEEVTVKIIDKAD